MNNSSLNEYHIANEGKKTVKAHSKPLINIRCIISFYIKVCNKQYIIKINMNYSLLFEESYIKLQ